MKSEVKGTATSKRLGNTAIDESVIIKIIKICLHIWLVVIYVFLLEEAMYSYCYLCILIVSLCYVCCLCIHTVFYVFLDAATLTEVFPCFSSVVRQMPGYNSQRRGTARTIPKFCCSVYYLCVNVYCTTTTGCQPNCS